MNATELIDAVAEGDKISKAKAKEVVNSVFSSIVEAVILRIERLHVGVSDLLDIKNSPNRS